MAIMQEKNFNEASWESKEFDWTGKSFYYISITNIFGNPLKLGSKMEQLNRELRQNGYRALNSIMLVQYTSFGGRIMVEVEKQDKYDSQALTFDDTTTAETIVYKTSTGSLSSACKRLRERVSSRRGMPPREIYYWLVNGLGSDTMVLFSIT